jgi:peptide/nickel transport system substrate-binding protein
MIDARSSLLRMLAVLFAFALVAAACGGDDDETGSDNDTEVTDGGAEEGAEGDGDGDAGDGAEEGDEGVEEVIVDDPEETPVAGGTLRYGLEADVDGINPTASALSAPGLMMANAVFDTLATYDENGVAVPHLAESFTPNDDGSVWTMKLREGIAFHDGTPLNAAAVIKNFEIQRSDPLVGLAVAPFYPAENAAVEIDDLTVEFNLLEPNWYFPGALAGQLGMTASPAWLDAALEDPVLDQQPVGTGPFVFDSRSEDSVTRFVRNDNYWKGEVFLDAVEFVPVTDPDTRADLLLQGELNALQTSSAGAISVLTEEGNGINNVLNDRSEESFAMINSASPPFDDIRARQALTHATPQQNYVDLIGLGVLRAANQPFTPESPYFNPDIEQLTDSPELAAPLVEEYCAEVPDSCSDGKINMELQWSGPSVEQTRIAELLDQGWSEFFNVTFQELPQDQHIQEAALGLYNVVTWRQFGAVDPWEDNVWLLCRTIGGISLNWPKFCDESRDAILLEAQATQDGDARIPLYQELAQKLNEDHLYIFFTHTLWDNAFHESVKGVCSHTTAEGITRICSVNGRTWFDNIWISE